MELPQELLHELFSHLNNLDRLSLTTSLKIDYPKAYIMPLRIDYNLLVEMRDRYLTCHRCRKLGPTSICFSCKERCDETCFSSFICNNCDTRSCIECYNYIKSHEFDTLYCKLCHKVCIEDYPGL